MSGACRRAWASEVKACSPVQIPEGVRASVQLEGRGSWGTLRPGEQEDGGDPKQPPGGWPLTAFPDSPNVSLQPSHVQDLALQSLPVPAEAWLLPLVLHQQHAMELPLTSGLFPPEWVSGIRVFMCLHRALSQQTGPSEGHASLGRPSARGGAGLLLQPFMNPSPNSVHLLKTTMAPSPSTSSSLRVKELGRLTQRPQPHPRGVLGPGWPCVLI